MTDAINSHSRRMYNAQKNTRAEAAEAALVAARNNVLASVGECLAGMSHEHASPFTRRQIKAAIERAFSTPREPTDDQ